MNADLLIVREFTIQAYNHCWQKMRDFTDQRDESSYDEIWLLQHQPVFTQGQNGKPEHILNPGDIPIIVTDRGGQVTYHGPGQLMVYTLLDIKRKQLSIRGLVTALEQAVIDFLQQHEISAYAKCDAPGVYVDTRKICSIGLRIRRGYTYHGIAFNVCMNLEPFGRINPCGFSNLTMTQLAELIEFSHNHDYADVITVGHSLIPFLARHLNYQQVQLAPPTNPH